MHTIISLLSLILCLPFSVEQDIPGSQTVSLWATYYYAPTLDHAPNGQDLLDVKGKPTGFKLDPCNWCEAAIEGTVFIEKDEQTYVLNYAGRSDSLQSDCRICERFEKYDGYAKTGRVLWQMSEGFGLGVRNYKLVPFKSIAVDPEQIPFGSAVFIPKAEGVTYLDETGNEVVHNGLFFAADTGSKIKGNHIDVYLGDESENPFGFVKSNAKGTFQAFLVSDPVTRASLEAIHR